MTGETNNVLEFSLADGRYCIDITHVDEIVDASEDVTPLPNSDRRVVGVVDLRGETTTIVDPAVALDLDEQSTGRRIVVLSEFDRTGLLIDDVHQVLDVEDEEVDTSNASESTHGVVRRDDRFVVWVEPAAIV